MKKQILFLFLITVSLINYASIVSINEAKNVGENYMKYVNRDFNTNIIEEITISYQNYDVIYVFNFKDGGYILISTDDETYPILSYSFEGKFIENDNNMPPAYARWIQWFEDQIVIAKTTNIKPLDKTVNAWKEFSHEKGIMSISPLLDNENIKWDQGCYYNADCPSDANGSCGHVYVGCVATAMAQIMRYHKYPDSGNGTHSFNDNYGTQYANFGIAIYDWNSMPGQLSSSNAEVAKISYHAGVSVDMMYGANGSGAYSNDVRDAFVNYFTYTTDATYAERTNYNDAEWKTIINASLDNEWPVYYSGDDGTSGGHAFVCDGYNSSNEYHFNWGWSGNYNSWNALDVIVPGGTGAGGGNGDYSHGNAIVYNIHPDIGLNANFNCDVTHITEGDQVNFNDASIDGGSVITSWSWTFTGGIPSSFSGQNPPAIIYNNEGNYEVSLSITTSGDSDIETKTGYITVVPIGNLFSLDFELPENYSQLFAPWSNIDVDGKNTYSSSDFDFTGEGSAFGFMAFNPTDAALASPIATTHGGERCGMASCPSDASAANNWLISDRIYIGTGSNFNFWVLTAKDYGLETYNVLVSTTDNNLSSFSTIANNEEAPLTWTNKTYSLASYEGQYVYVAIQHVSVDKFLFFIDDIEITGATTESKIIDGSKISIYPNPAKNNVTFTNVENSNIIISDINGKIVLSQYANSNNVTIDINSLNKGTYIARIINDKSIAIKKLIIE